jgi:predicted TIM-barrel fold metal-dependent hydrolase
MEYQLVSADGHINELPGLWTDGAPEHIADLVPRVVSDEESGDMWVLAPKLPPRKMGSSAAVGAEGSSGYKPTATYKEMRPGSFDPAARVADMQLDGVDAEVLYPGQGRAHHMFATEEVRLYCARRYNDWMAEFQGAAPEHLVGLAILPQLDDGDHALQELQRAADLGLRGAFLALGIDGRPISDPQFESFWATAAERQIPISFHIGNSRQHWVLNQGDLGPGVREAAMSMLPMGVGEQLAQLVFSGLLDRYPQLRIVLAECGIGWVPFFLQRMDAVAHKHGHAISEGLDRLPSEVFQSQCYVTFQEDVVGIRLRDLIGEGSIMWASDYPHSETTWPNSQATVEREFKDTPDEARARILAGNCVELYHLDAR